MPHIYVAAGNDGLVKVGRTVNIERRRGLLARQFKQFGNQLNALSAFECADTNTAESAEFWLLYKIRDVFALYAGREWFLGNFEDACAAAQIAVEECSFRKRRAPLSPLRLARLSKIRALKKERAQREKAARIEAYEKGVRERRALRELRKREMAERILGLKAA